MTLCGMHCVNLNTDTIKILGIHFSEALKTMGIIQNITKIEECNI